MIERRNLLDTAEVTALPDQELIALARQGDEVAAKAVCVAVLPAMQQAACHYERNPQNREDHIQGSMERLLRAYVLPKPEGEEDTRDAFQGNLNSLAEVITRHIIYDSHRHLIDNTGHRREVALTESFQDTIPSKEDTESEVINNSCDRIDTLLDRAGCTWEIAQTVKLHYVAGLSVKEVANIMECPVNTVVSRSKRGLDRIKQMAHITPDSPYTDIFENYDRSTTALS